MTAHQLQKISIEQLRPGMFVGNVFNSKGTLLYSSNTPIQSQEQIDALIRQGVKSLTINLEKGSGGVAAAKKKVLPAIEQESSVSKPERVNVFSAEEIEKAQVVRQDALQSVQNIMSSIKTGRLFSLGSVVACVESIVESMIDDPELMINLCRIKTHKEELYTHSVNVAVLMIGFSSALGYSNDKITAAGIGGLLHDIGLLSLPEELFSRVGTCTRQEYELFKKHPQLGLDLIGKKSRSYPEGVLEVIGQHHERHNGEGYPLQIPGRNIHDLATICAITDMYDTLTSVGMHYKVYQPQEALALIFQGADEEFPRSFVEHFTKLLGIYPVGSFVKLDTGEMGVVIKNNRNKMLAPTVRILFNEQGKRLVTPYIKDLSVSDPHSADSLSRILYSLNPASHKLEIDQFIIQKEC